MTLPETPLRTSRSSTEATLQIPLKAGATTTLFWGAGGNDYLRGYDGKDTLSGGTQNDTIDGDAGEDRLNGDEGNDSLDGGADNDSLTGGIGDDKLKAVGVSTQWTVGQAATPTMWMSPRT